MGANEAEASASASASTSAPGPSAAPTEPPSSAVQVAVRVRPLNSVEAAQACQSCVNVVAKSVLLSGKRYDFDAAFPPPIQQEHVHEELVTPLLDRFFDGYNATVFAYGQTGSGKTFTMGNEFKASVDPTERGIIPRVVDDIFGRMEAAAAEGRRYTVKVSYLEILNEEIYDLLAKKATSAASTGLAVRDDSKLGIVVAGLSEHCVESVDEVAGLLRSGALGRATASTTMNAQSSRSHAICTLTMEQREVAVAEDGGGTETRLSKFHLVDLAGSERVKRTNAQGARFKEGVNINRGLLSLGNVINALCEKSRTQSSTIHVPYRDSKLTRLLQDSLGGNSKTLMIACISPADVNYEESSNTLRYASRARSIENMAVINKELSSENEVAQLKQQLEIMQLQLLQQSWGVSGGSGARRVLAGGSCSVRSASTFDEGELEKELRRLRDQLALALSAKDKWKKVADELSVNHGRKPASGFGSNGPESLAMKEAMEFEKRIQVAPLIPTGKGPAEAGSKLLRSELANLSDVILEKEKIMQELASSPSLASSDTGVRLASLTNSYEQKIVLLEKEVDVLTAERRELARKMRQTQGKPSLADTVSEDNRSQSKLQKLQSQLQVAKEAGKECKRLAALWKAGSLKISTLQQEITAMKRQKAALQRKLKEEAQQHRKDKREQELKILQLKRQQQHKKYELQKLTALHSKQNNVLKRKTEEAATANKRVRTLQHQHQQLQKMQRPKPERRADSPGVPVSDAQVLETIMTLLRQTIETQVTISGAKNVLQLDLEERKALAVAIARLEAASTGTLTENEQLNRMQGALREKNGEIRLLQQKLASVERNRGLPSGLFPTKVAVCHQLIRQLVEIAVESKEECLALATCRADLVAAEEELVAQREKSEESSSASVMEELSASGPSESPTAGAQGTEQTLALEKELGETRKQLEMLRGQAAAAVVETKKAPAKFKPRPSLDVVDLLSSSEEEDDRAQDPDYVEEHEGREATEPKESVASPPSRAKSSEKGGILAEIDELLAKSEAGACCSCHGKCATKACACKTHQRICGGGCSCNVFRCLNRVDSRAKPKRKKARIADDKENELVAVFDDQEDSANGKHKLKKLRKSGDKTRGIRIGKSVMAAVGKTATSSSKGLGLHTSTSNQDIGLSTSTAIGRFF